MVSWGREETRDKRLTEISRPVYSATRPAHHGAHEEDREMAKKTVRLFYASPKGLSEGWLPIKAGTKAEAKREAWKRFSTMIPSAGQKKIRGMRLIEGNPANKR